MIPVNRPLLDGNEKKYLNQCIESGWISSEGPFVRQFEEQFAARMDRKHGIAVSNGSVELDPILSLAAEHGIPILEDAAEMHGQTYKGRPCGAFGEISTFSFYPNKHVTTGEGGMILTDDECLSAKCRSLRN